MPTAEEDALQAASFLSDDPSAVKVADSLRQSAQILMTEVDALRDAADAIEAQAERLARHAAALEGKPMNPTMQHKLDDRRFHHCGDLKCEACNIEARGGDEP